MIERYEIINKNKNDVLIIYLNYNYEFGKMLENKVNEIKIKDKIRKYINYKKINFTGKKVVIMANNFILGSMFI